MFIKSSVDVGLEHPVEFGGSLCCNIVCSSHNSFKELSSFQIRLTPTDLPELVETFDLF